MESAMVNHNEEHKKAIDHLKTENQHIEDTLKIERESKLQLETRLKNEIDQLNIQHLDLQNDHKKSEQEISQLKEEVSKCLDDLANKAQELETLNQEKTDLANNKEIAVKEIASRLENSNLQYEDLKKELQQLKGNEMTEYC